MWSNGFFFGRNIINSVLLAFKESLLAFNHWERFYGHGLLYLPRCIEIHQNKGYLSHQQMISSGIFYAVMKIIDVNKEKRRTKNWTLRNSCQDCLNCRVMVINWYKLFSIGQIRTEPVLCNASYPIVLKFPNKCLMNNRIKCFFQVYKSGIGITHGR